MAAQEHEHRSDARQAAAAAARRAVVAAAANEEMATRVSVSVLMMVDESAAAAAYCLPNAPGHDLLAQQRRRDAKDQRRSRRPFKVSLLPKLPDVTKLPCVITYRAPTTPATPATAATGAGAGRTRQEHG
jgi:hypothetical protein